jgi:hypothetical protein
MVRAVNYSFKPSQRQRPERVSMVTLLGNFLSPKSAEPIQLKIYYFCPVTSLI